MKARPVNLSPSRRVAGVFADVRVLYTWLGWKVDVQRLQKVKEEVRDNRTTRSAGVSSQEESMCVPESWSPKANRGETKLC